MDKAQRILDMNRRLINGEILEKKRLSEMYDVALKTVQRDIEELRYYYSRHGQNINYDMKKQGYIFSDEKENTLNSGEILAICKVLLESRGFSKKEIKSLMKKMIAHLSDNNRKFVEEMIKNEEFNYIPLQHNKNMLTPIWEISQYIFNKEIINIGYTRKDMLSKRYDVKPISIMFSEYYFYLIAYMVEKKDEFPTIFRIDRISEIVGKKKKFVAPYINRFEEGEFRKRVQFMYTGELCRVKFEYAGFPEYVLDRLPTAEILSEREGVFTISAEVYGREGIEMWLRSQGDKVRMLE